jgi:phosphinothricin acetyltransferase
MSMDVRLATGEDAAAVAGIYRRFVESSAITFETEAPTVAEMRDRIERTLSTHPWLVCDVDGSCAGYAYASQHRTRAAYQWSCDVAVYVQPDRHRRGIGRSLYRSLFAILTAQGYANACAGITLPNPKSVGLHEALGFRPIGVYPSIGYKAGAWHDVGWWQMRLAESDASPAPLLPLADLRRRADWTSLLKAGVRD